MALFTSPACRRYSAMVCRKAVLSRGNYAAQLMHDGHQHKAFQADKCQFIQGKVLNLLLTFPASAHLILRTHDTVPGAKSP